MHLGAIVASGTGVYLDEPRLELVIHHEVVAVQLPGLLAVFNQVLAAGGCHIGTWSQGIIGEIPVCSTRSEKSRQDKSAVVACCLRWVTASHFFNEFEVGDFLNKYSFRFIELEFSLPPSDSAHQPLTPRLFQDI